MAKIKMRYKEIAARVTKFMFKDITLIENQEDKKNAQAFQRFIEYMAIPGGTKEYTDELCEIYILEALIRADTAKQKEAKGVKKVVTEIDQRTKKFIAQKQREKFWNKIKGYFVK